MRLCVTPRRETRFSHRIKLDDDHSNLAEFSSFCLNARQQVNLLLRFLKPSSSSSNATMPLSPHLVAILLFIASFAPAFSTAKPGIFVQCLSLNLSAISCYGIAVASLTHPPPSPSSPPPSPLATTSTIRRQTRSATTKNVVLWPNGIVPFEIDSSLLKVKGNIRDAMNQYMQKSCVHFQPRTTETAYILFTKGKDCSSSFIGCSGKKEEISLGAGCQSLGVIVHEIGHALGLIHEHMRTDSELFVFIHDNNIEPGYETQFAISLENRNLTPYDYDSIMHYGTNPFSIDPQRKKTITAIDDVRLLNPSQKSRLSELDVFAVNFLYNCTENKKK